MTEPVVNMPEIKQHMSLRMRVHTLICILLLILPVSAVFADDILLIARHDAPVDTLSRAEAANLFLGIGPTHPLLTPFDQKDLELRERFYREIAGLSTASVRAHWSKIVFTGRGRPPKVLELEEVEDTIGKTPSAVTYVPAGYLPSGTKVLLTLEAGEGK